MRSALVLLLLLSGVCAISPLKAQTTHPGLTFYHLTGDLYVYTTYRPFEGAPYPANSMYLVTDKGVVMFDTPWDTTQLQPFLDSIEARHHQKVILSISTHFHSDRTAGLNFLKSKGVKTYASQRTNELCKKRKEEQPQYTFSGDTTFTVGNHTFQAFYPGPGHTEDNIVILFPAEKVIDGACFVKSTESEGLGNIADANLKVWKASVKKLMKKFPKPAYVIPGHMGWDGDGLQHTISLLKKSGH